LNNINNDIDNFEFLNIMQEYLIEKCNEETKMEVNADEKILNWGRRFFTIWTGQAFSLLGSQLVSFAVIWWLTQTTGSATVLATASLVGLIPQVVLGPLTGALVDRWNRRLTMIFADASIALATIGLAVLFALGHVQVWQVYALLFIRSVGGGFHWPAMQASTSLMVPKEHLARIQGLNQMLQGGMNIASAPLGALLLAVLPMEGILAIDVFTAMLAIIPLLFYQVPQPERLDLQADLQTKSSVWTDLLAGFHYVWNWPGLMMIGVMATIINFLLTPAFSLLPILVTKHFNGQAIQLASLESFSGIGFIVGGLVLSAWGGFKRRIMTSLLGLFAMGAGCLVMGLLPPTAFVFAVATMLFLGIINPIVNGPLLAAVQAAVAPEMQGRVFTLISTLAAGMSPIGLIIAGPISDKLGVQTWFLIGGVVTILMGGIGLMIPAVMHFEEGRKIEAPKVALYPTAISPEIDIAHVDVPSQPRSAELTLE
jgi:DHA3 family macrolide efflux protein-like MFS transporter